MSKIGVWLLLLVVLSEIVNPVADFDEDEAFRRWLSPAGRKMDQGWLQELIKQEKEDREVRADVEILRESDEMSVGPVKEIDEDSFRRWLLVNAAWEGIEGAIEGDDSGGGGEKKGDQDWLKELIKQEEEDREVRASVEVLRESDEMADFHERMYRTDAAERAERASRNEREESGMRGEHNMQFQRMERAEREDRGVRVEAQDREDRQADAEQSLNGFMSGLTDRAEARERLDRENRAEDLFVQSQLEKKGRDAIAYGRFLNHQTETQLGALSQYYYPKNLREGYHVAEPEVAVGEAEEIAVGEAEENAVGYSFWDDSEEH